MLENENAPIHFLMFMILATYNVDFAENTHSSLCMS